MADSIGKAVLEIATDLSKFTTKDAEKSLANLVGLSKESMTALGQGAGLALAGVAALAGGIVALGVRGADVSDMRGSFDQLNQTIGNDSVAVLGALKTSFAGTVSDFDLMGLANKAMSQGLKVSAADFGLLGDSARVLADRGLGTAEDAFTTLSQAMATGKLKSAELLIGNIDAEQSWVEYGRSIGKTATELTEAEKISATSIAVTQRLKDEVLAGGKAQFDFGDAVQASGVLVKNFKDALGEAIATSPVVQAAMNGIASAITGAVGTNQANMVKSLTGFVNEFAIKVTYAADTLIFFGQRGNEVLTLLKVVIAGVGTAVTFMGEMWADALAGVLKVAAKIPGIGKMYIPAQKAMEETRVLLNGMRTDYQKQVEEAIAGGARNKAALDTVQKAVVTVRAAMIAAKDAQVGLTGATDVGAQALRNVKPVIEEVTKAQKEAADAAKKKATEYRQYLNWIGERRMEDEGRVLADLAAKEAAYRQFQNDLGARHMEQDALNNQTLTDRANAMGFQTRAQLQETADKAKALWQEMRESGEVVYSELERAHKQWKDAEQLLDEKVHQSAMSQFELLANSAATILTSIFAESKRAAIAAALINTFAAIVKSFAIWGWPWGIAPAAAAAAAGYAQVRNIQHQEFALGTPNLDFLDFGSESLQLLHNDEAIIPRGGGHQLAGEIAAALADGSRGDAALPPIQIDNRLEIHLAVTGVLDENGLVETVHRRIIPIWQRAVDDNRNGLRTVLRDALGVA